jgi:hypothetical protein
MVWFREFFEDDTEPGSIYDPVTYRIDTEQKALSDGRQAAYHFNEPAWCNIRGAVWNPDSVMGITDPAQGWVSTREYFDSFGLEIALSNGLQHNPGTDADNMMRSFIGCYQIANLRNSVLPEDFASLYPTLASRHNELMDFSGFNISSLIQTFSKELVGKTRSNIASTFKTLSEELADTLD